MKKRTINRVIASLAAVLAVCLLAGALWSQRFADFAHTERATEFYLRTTGSDHTLREAQPNPEEMGPLLTLLENGTLRLSGRSRFIQWEGGDILYHLSFYHEEDGTWVQDAEFDLCTDGSVYVSHDWLGFLRYRLTGCDLEQVDAALARLLGIGREARE